MISYESSYSILIGHRIRNERIALGMTQSEFAKLLGISPSYLGALERGTRPVSRSIMNRLHEKTHISYDYLLEGLEKPDDTCRRFCKRLHGAAVADLERMLGNGRNQPFQNFR